MRCQERHLRCAFTIAGRSRACLPCRMEKAKCEGAEGTPKGVKRVRSGTVTAEKGKGRAAQPQASGSGVWTSALGAVWAAEPGTGLSTDGLLLRLVGEVQGLWAELAEFRPEVESLRDSVERVRAANRQYRAELAEVIPEALQLKSRLAALEDYYRDVLGEEVAGELEEESAEETEANGDRAEEESEDGGVLGGAPPAEEMEGAEGEVEGPVEDAGAGETEVGEGSGGAAA